MIQHDTTSDKVQQEYELINGCATKLCPCSQMLIGKSVSVWCSVKQFEKALPLVQKLDSEGVHSDEVRLNCAQTLHHCSKNEAAYQWLKKLQTSIGSLSDEMKQEVSNRYPYC